MPKKNSNYNSDYMSRKMDEKLGQLEDDLTALYANAAYDVNADFAAFAKTYEKQLAEMEAKYTSGEITEAELNSWKQQNILQTEKYKATVDSITNKLVNVDKEAMAIIRDTLPSVVAESYNFTQALGFAAAQNTGLTVGTFQVYNARSVQKLLKENPQLLPYVKAPLDKQWNKDHVNKAITNGIIQGKSIPDIADSLQAVTNMDRNSAIRNARTAMTGAENMGRAEAAADLREAGVPVEEMWSATHDDRTRETHLKLDGTLKDKDGYFGVGILDTPLRYAGDPLGDGEEVYNCRCRTSILLQGIDHSKDKELYQNFMRQYETAPEGKITVDKEEA